MDNLFTANSDSPVQQIKKKNNAQIISTLRSETEYDINKEKYKKKHHNDVKNNHNENNRSNKNDSIKEDIVNIAETIHNLVNMMTIQIDKISNLEKEIEKIKFIENKANELSYDNKKKVIKSGSIMSENFNSITASALKKKSELNKNFNSQKNIVKNNCNTESCNDFKTTKNVEYKLNSVVKGFNSQLINLKRKNALIASSYTLKKKK